MADLKSVPVSFGIAGTIAGLAGYFLGSKFASNDTEEDTNFSKMVSELKAERNEVFQQVLDKENYDFKNKLVTGVQTDKFVLFGADLCPFAQRAWITLVEKKIPFDHIHVNIANKSLAVTQKLTQINPKSAVPAGIHKGQHFCESLDIMYYLEEAYPSHSILPTEPSDRYKSRALLRKYQSVVPLWYQQLGAQEPEKIAKANKEMTQLLTEFNGDIVGPYIMGPNFSFLDIALIPWFARLDLIIGHYKNYRIPAELTKIHEWIKNCISRESFKATVQDRTDESMQVQPYHNREYKAYLLEVYESYACGRTAEMRAALANSVGPLPKEKVREILYSKKQ